MPKSGGMIDTAGGILLARGAVGGAKRLRKLAFRWRRALTPVWCALFLWLTAIVWRWLIPAWWPLAALLPALGVTLALIGPKLSERWSAVAMKFVPDTLDTGKVGVMDRPVERVFFGSLCGYVGLWECARIALGPSAATAWTWQAGLAVFGGIYWFHRRIRVAGRADKFARKWPRISDRDTCPPMLTPLIGSKVVRAEGGKALNGTVRLCIELKESMTPDVVTRLAGHLASYYNLRPGAVFPSADEHKARRVWLTFLPKDPWKSRLTHPAPPVGSYSLAEMDKRLALGLTAQGARVVWSVRHLQLVGDTGSGKSGLLHSIMYWITGARDAIAVGIDMAGGATMGVWRRSLALPLAIDVVDALAILRAVLAVIEDREKQLGLQNDDDDDAVDAFEPTAETPWLFLVIDELPDLVTQAKGDFKIILDLLGRIAKKARKAGVRIVAASQNGTKPDWGTKEFQAQLAAMIGLRLSAAQSRNFWEAYENQGWRSTGLREGEFLLRDHEHAVPEKAKGYWVVPKDRRNRSREAAELGKTLEPTAWAALHGGAAPVVLVEADPTHPLIDYLQAHGPATIDELTTALGRARSTIYRWVNEQVEAGRVVNARGTVTFVPIEDRAGAEKVSRPMSDSPA